MEASPFSNCKCEGDASRPKSPNVNKRFCFQVSGVPNDDNDVESSSDDEPMAEEEPTTSKTVVKADPKPKSNFVVKTTLEKKKKSTLNRVRLQLDVLMQSVFHLFTSVSRERIKLGSE